MTRFTHALAALALGGTASIALVAGCGRPTSEMPPLAPRPEPMDPAGAPSGPKPGPKPGMIDPAAPTSDAGTPSPTVAPSTRSPVSQTTMVPMPSFQGDHGPAATPVDGGHEVEPPTNVKGGPVDAGVKDSYAPPLPPVPDAHLPDSRLEPSGQPMPGGLEQSAEAMPAVR
jgi:hypothetical protein